MAEWLHRLADGNPRVTLELAQHLVDSGVARYEAGAWILPSSLDALNIPGGLEQALDARIGALSPRARALAEALSLSTDHEPLLLSEYAALVGNASWKELFTALDELVAASVLTLAGETYVLADRVVKAALERSLPTDRRAAYHRQLALAHGLDDRGTDVLRAYHLFEAGDPEAAFTTLVGTLSGHVRKSPQAKSFVRSPTGARFYERMFEWAVESRVSPKQLMVLGRAVLQLASAVDVHLVRHAAVVLERLHYDMGLAYWDEYADISDPGERAQQCVRRALEEYERIPENERGLAPVPAIQTFALCVAMLSGVYARICEPDEAVALTEPMDRLRPLAPAVDVMADIVGYTAHALRGFCARELRLRVLDQLAEPVMGFDDGVRVGTRMITLYYQALSEAVLGDPQVFDRIAMLEGRPQYAPLVWQVRVIAHLYQGAEKRAETCRRRRDLVMTGRVDVDRQIETSIAYEADAYVTLRDLMGLKRILPALRSRAERFIGWEPHYLTAEGGYRALRGELLAAKGCFERALRITEPGHHVEWLKATCGFVRVLLQLERFEDADRAAREALEICARFPFVAYQVHQLESLLAWAEARLANGQAATTRIRLTIERAEGHGTRGIHLIDLYATHAEIARALEDETTFAEVSRRIVALCTPVESASFAARLSSLLDLPITGGFEAVASSPRRFGRSQSVTPLASRIRTELDICRGAEER